MTREISDNSLAPHRLGWWTALLIVLFILPSLQSLKGQTSPTPDGHLELKVNNGTGTGGGYRRGDVASVAAFVPTGYEFLKWFHISGDGIITDPLASQTEYTMGQFDAEITGTFAKLEAWFPPGPESNKKGLLLAKPVSGSATRLEHRLRVTLDRGTGYDLSYADVWAALQVKINWELADRVRYFTAETGGIEITNQTLLPKASFESTTENIYEISIWYEGKITQEEVEKLISDNKSPNVKVDLRLVVNNYDRGKPWSGELIPLEINSLDRYVEIKVPDSLINSFIGKNHFRLSVSSEHNEESYEIGLDQAIVYQETSDSRASGEGIFFPHEEATAISLVEKTYHEGVAPIAVSNSNGKYQFHACLNQIRNLRISIKMNGIVIGSTPYALTPNPDMSYLIDSLQHIFEEVFEKQKKALDPPPDDEPPVLAGMAKQEGFSISSGISYRNLVAKCCSAVFGVVKTAVRQGVVLGAEGVQIAVVGAQGFCQGFWSGVKSDAKEFEDLLLHPLDTGKAIYEGFRGLCNMRMDKIKEIPKKMLEEYLTEAQKNIAWAEPTATDLLAYTVGYSAGYLAEQLVVSVITSVFAGPAIKLIATTGGKVAKIMKTFEGTSKILGAVATGKELAAKLQKAKNLAVKSCSQFVTSKTGLDKIEPIVQRTLMAGCTTP